MKLTMNELEYLKKYRSNDNFLSFFKGFKGELSGNEAEALEKKNAVNGEELSPFLKRVVEPLDNPETSVRVAVQIGTTMVEKLCYRKDEEVVLLENHGDFLNVTIPLGWDLSIAEISEVIPMSSSIMAQVDETFNPFEISMILLLLDLQRKNVVLDYWGEPSKVMHTFDELMVFKNNMPDGSLLKLCNAQYGIPLANESEAMTILESLARKGVISLTSGYKLEGEYETLGGTFGQLQYLTLAEIFNKDQEDLKTAGFVVLSGGQNSHLWLDITGDERRIRTVSGHYLLKALESVFDCPALD